MLEIIKYCFAHGKVVSFYCNKEDTTLHLTGYICAYNDSEILIKHISMHGRYDGFILKRIEDIYRMDYDSNYEEKIERLYILRKQSHCDIETGDDEILYSMLDFALKNNFVVSLELQDNSVEGIVEKYDENFVFIESINEYGKKNGVSVIKVDEVITIAMDTDDEQDLYLLKC